MKNKYFFIYLLLLFCRFSLKSQQVEQFTILRENAISLNPAYCGVRGFFSSTATFRKQFTEISQSPYTAFIEADGQIQEKNFGIGGMFIQDQTGPTGKTGVTAMASYHLRLNEHETVNLDNQWFNNDQTHMITFGLSLSVLQYRLNGARLTPEQQNDPQIYAAPASQVYPDASVGVHYQYGRKFFADISCPQLLGLNTKYKYAGSLASIRKVQHLSIMLGGQIDLGDEKKFSINPIGALRFANNAPPQADLGARFYAYKVAWLGLNYRTTSALILEAGVNIKKIIKIGYACDVNVSKYSRSIGTTHEVTIQVTLKNKPGAASGTW